MLKRTVPCISVILVCFILLWRDMILMPLGGKTGKTGHWVDGLDVRGVVGARWTTGDGG